MAFYPAAELLPQSILERAERLGSALLADGAKALGGIEKDGALEAGILPVHPSMHVVGTALTVQTDNGDNFPIHVATYSAEPGYVMVIDGNDCMERAYFGDLIMGAAKAVGFLGMIVNGCVRDYDGCIALQFPVYAKGLMQRGPIKKDPGSVNAPIVCGGVPVAPGDLVVGDSDGVTVVPRAKIEAVFEKAEEKQAYEIKRRASIRQYNECKAAGQPLPNLAPQWVLDMLKQ